MARINIEDKLYKDGRFIDLCIALGSRRAALGALVEAWTLCQSFVTPENPCGLMPKQAWLTQRIADEILTCKFAEFVGEEIILSGALEQFKWLVDLQIKGRKSGASRRKGNQPLESNTGSTGVERGLNLLSPSSFLLDLKQIQEEPRSRKSASLPPFAISSVEQFAGALIEYVPDWEQIYSKAHVKDETLKAIVWLRANPKKNRKTLRGWVQFFSGWFERGWDRTTTRGPSNATPSVTPLQLSTAKVIAALKSHSDWGKERDTVIAMIGEELYRIAIKAGTHKMRTLPGDSFYQRNVMGMLRQAAQEIGVQL